MRASSSYRMRRVAAASICVSLIVSSPTSALTQRVDGEFQTGSRDRQRFKPLDADHAGQIDKEFARCVYRRNKDAVWEMLANSNALEIDTDVQLGVIFREDKPDRMEQAKLAKMYRVEECLGIASGAGRTMQSRISATRFRSMMAEEAYLASHKRPPVLSGNAEKSLPRFHSKDAVSAATVDGMAALVDCLTFTEAEKADALLRTPPGSSDERSAAIALAPTLGSCMTQGQTFKMTPLTIRALVADGMWARYARTTH